MAFFEFPHTRTYDSDLAWLIHAYKVLKAQADDIQASIQQIVDDTLNDPTYVARVLAVLAPLNVKYPPSDAGLDAAKGDGVTDDTSAITGMIAYAYEHNMPLLFPAGQYVVSGLTISNEMTFIGLGGTLFLKAGAVNPLITVKGGYLTATGIDFNGNIAGQTDPKNVFVVDGGGFKLDNCAITGGVDGIHANIDNPSFITGVDIDNFTEYGVYVEGSSFINANGVTMNVASGGALRLIRVDASNCVFNGIESLAEVAIAFDVTGDFNYFLARVPNAETPTSDSGQNNNFEIIAQLSKRTYQNVMEKVEGDYTQEVDDFDGTATGHYLFEAPNINLYAEVQIGGQTQYLKILNSGMILAGLDQQIVDGALQYADYQFSGRQNNTAGGCIGLIQHSNDASCAQVTFGKTRGTTPENRVALQENDDLGEIRYTGVVNNAYVDGGYITSAVDRTVTNDMTRIPTRIILAGCDGYNSTAGFGVWLTRVATSQKLQVAMEQELGGGSIAEGPDGYYGIYSKLAMVLPLAAGILWNYRYKDTGFKAIDTGNIVGIVPSGSGLDFTAEQNVTKEVDFTPSTRMRLGYDGNIYFLTLPATDQAPNLYLNENNVLCKTSYDVSAIPEGTVRYLTGALRYWDGSGWQPVPSA